MKKMFKSILFFSMVMGVSVSSAWAEDSARGKSLHDPSCLTDCHAKRANGAANTLYTREKSLKSLEKLKSQVSFCNQQVLQSEWWPEDEADVVDYLNGAFYKFK